MVLIVQLFYNSSERATRGGKERVLWQMIWVADTDQSSFALSFFT